MQAQVYSTKSANGQDNLNYWNQVVCETYFQLSTSSPSRRDREFAGTLHTHTCGPLGISTLESSALNYQRTQYHVSKENEDYFLVTLPYSAPIYFAQNGREVECQPGEFILEGSADPYVFNYSESNRLTVLKIPGPMLRNRVFNVDNFCALGFPAQVGSAALFKDFLSSIMLQAEHINKDLGGALAEQLIELLGITLDSKTDSLPLAEKSVQKAHLCRIQRFINTNLTNSQLCTQLIAQNCQISVRYLHQLFENSGWSVSNWIRERRLEECYKILSDPTKALRSIAELAYSMGFSDQAHFNRCFKSRYKCTPGTVRAEAAKNRI